MVAKRRNVEPNVWALYLAKSIVLDSSGNGTLTFFPEYARERWLVNFINVTCTSAAASTLVPTMTMYRSAPVAAYRIGGSYNGLGDTNSTDQILLNMNESIYMVWTGGDPGQTATARLEGSRYVWG